MFKIGDKVETELGVMPHKGTIKKISKTCPQRMGLGCEEDKSIVECPGLLFFDKEYTGACGSCGFYYRKIEEEFKVNDWVKYIGKNERYLTKGNLYRVIEVNLSSDWITPRIQVINNWGEKGNILKKHFSGEIIKVPKKELFKVGGRGLVRKDLKTGKNYGGGSFVREMSRTLGKWVDIESTLESVIEMVSKGYSYTPEMFDQIEYSEDYKLNKKIVEGLKGIVSYSDKPGETNFDYKKITSLFEQIDNQKGGEKFEVGDVVERIRNSDGTLKKGFIRTILDTRNCNYSMKYNVCGDCKNKQEIKVKSGTKSYFEKGKPIEKWYCATNFELIRKGNKKLDLIMKWLENNPKDMVEIRKSKDFYSKAFPTKEVTKMINKEIVKRYKKTEDAVLVDKWFRSIFESSNVRVEFDMIILDETPGALTALLRKARELEKEEKKAEEDK